METYIGILKSIWVIDITPLVITFAVETIDEEVICVFYNSEIAHKILFLPNEIYTAQVSGETNSNGQFVVTKFQIRNLDRNVEKLGL
ncbi:hypothetical protein D922_03423 [Enterococcus faecalis 06-MB-DW-09]|nr:hypothetical protein D922_03423 [Enterococcus faecalis 06-MB-DW-09]